MNPLEIIKLMGVKKLITMIRERREISNGVKEAYLYQKLSGNKVKCQNCAHFCLILQDRKGICNMRENREGRLYSLNYGKLCALNIDPIEKKPLFHFLPGSNSLSIAAVGCNFKCKSCQNYEISQALQAAGQEISPKNIIKIALQNKLPSISYTYTEPAIFSEYALDIMKLSKKEGIKNVWVSNGYWSKELFNLISPYLDAVNIDLKSFQDSFYIKYCQAKIKPVLETLKRLKDKRIWIEITTLIIPGLNDKEDNIRKIAQFIKKELGRQTPWHITQFCGAISWKLKNIPDTPLETLRKAYQIGKEEGLDYVYTGNFPGLESENTFCPKCKSIVIERKGYFIQRHDKNGKCPKCGKVLNLIL